MRIAHGIFLSFDYSYFKNAADIKVSPPIGKLKTESKSSYLSKNHMYTFIFAYMNNDPLKSHPQIKIIKYMFNANSKATINHITR